MKNIYFKLGLVSACVITLVASGSSSSVSYELLKSTNDATSKLAGTAIQSNNTTGELKIVSNSGELKHKSGEMTIEAGGYKLADKDGFDSKGVLTDDTSVLTYTSGEFAGSYEYASGYEQTYKVSGTSFNLTGITGVVILDTEMPSSGSATFAGDALASIVTAGGAGYNLKGGKSSVSANFASGKVALTMDGFTATDKISGAGAAAPIDAIKITDMTISNSGFSGGTFVTSKAGVAVDLTGGNKINAASGNFYGYDSASKAPAEVGGTVLMKGDDGLLVGTFIGK